jgi:hypothetical protein
MSEQKHEHILQQLFAHPVARNIEWSELIPALADAGDLQVEKNGNYRFTRGDHTLVFEARGKEVDVEEVIKLRHFLESSEISDTNDPDLVDVVIIAVDHHKAAVYRNFGTGFEKAMSLHADLTEERKLHSHPTTAPYHEQSPLPENDYYESLIDEIAKSGRVVILSHGTGTSNAGEQLMDMLDKKHSDLVAKIVAVKDCDLEAMSDSELIKLGAESL